MASSVSLYVELLADSASSSTYRLTLEAIEFSRNHSVCLLGRGHTTVVMEDNRLLVLVYSQYGQVGLVDKSNMCDAQQLPE